MWLLVMNFAKVTNKILEVCIQDNLVNYTGYGNIYSLNAETIKDYPAIWVYCPSGITNTENLATASYFLVYIDRVTNRADDNNIEDLLIHSNGHRILSNIIAKIGKLDDIFVDNDNVSFTIFDGIEGRSDNCNGLYAQLDVSWPIENCVVD